MLLFASNSAHAHSYKQGDISIGHIWARATPTGATTAAIYVPLLNNGKETDRVWAGMGVSREKWIQALARNLTAANATLRCGAKTRSGNACKAPAANGKRRCRMHGGALGSGAPSGERNGRYKVGRFTKEAKADRRETKELIRIIFSFADVNANQIF